MDAIPPISCIFITVALVAILIKWCPNLQMSRVVQDFKSQKLDLFLEIFEKSSSARAPLAPPLTEPLHKLSAQILVIVQNSKFNIVFLVSMEWLSQTKQDSRIKIVIYWKLLKKGLKGSTSFLAFVTSNHKIAETHFI